MCDRYKHFKFTINVNTLNHDRFKHFHEVLSSMVTGSLPDLNENEFPAQN